MHPVGVVKRDATRLAHHFLHGVIRKSSFEFEQDGQRIHGPETTAELRDDIEVVLVVSPAVRDCRVDRHRTLRIEMLNLTLKPGVRFQMLANGPIATSRLPMERGRKLSAKGDFR